MGLLQFYRAKVKIFKQIIILKQIGHHSRYCMKIFETIIKSLYHKIECQPPVYPKVVKLLIALILPNS